MKKSKLFILSGLAMLTMAFAMSCSNPAGGDTTPAPEENAPKGVHVKTFEELRNVVADASNERIVFDNDIEMPQGVKGIQFTRDIVIDLNNKKLTTKANNETDAYPINPLGNSHVTIKNGSLVHATGLIIDMGGTTTVTLENVTIVSTNPAHPSIQLRTNTTLNLNNSNITGTICILQNVSGSSIYVNEGTTLTAIETSGAIQSLSSLNNNIYLKKGATINRIENGESALYIKSGDIKENNAVVNGKIIQK